MSRPKVDDKFVTDAHRPSALPSASLIPRANALAAQASITDQTSDVYLASLEEEWNKKVDTEVETLVEGMVDLVGIAPVGGKDKFRIAQETFQAQCRAESMVRAANSLLSITHSLKLIWLLSDEAQLVAQREAELTVVRAESESAKARAIELLDAMLTAEL